MISLKDDSVSLVGLRPQIVFALMAAERVFNEMGVGCIVTSVNDAYHKRTSLHYDGAAVDLRTKHLQDTSEKRAVQKVLSSALGPDFDVILEYVGQYNEHLHIEWQPRRRE